MQTAVFSKIFADRSAERAVEVAADLGYDGIELMGRAPHLPPDTSLERAERLARLIDDRGLSVPCLATYTGDYVGTSDEEDRRALRDLERFLRLADVFDCDVVRHAPAGPPPAAATDADFEEAAAGMGRAADLAAEYGATLCVEIHAMKLAETVDSTLRLLDLIDRENVGVIHDAGNMFIVGADYGPETVEALGERLVHVHVKDEQRVTDPSASDAHELDHPDGPHRFRPRLLGEGDVDHRPLFGALAERGYDGFLTAECHVPQPAPGDDRRVAEHELSALRKLVADADAR